MRELVTLVKLVAGDKGKMSLAAFCGFLASASSVGLMATAAYLISQAALQPPLYTLTLVILGVRAFGLARAGFRYLERYVSHQVTFTILGQLRTYFYNQLEPMAPGIFRRYRSGDLLSRVVADVESLQYFFLRALYPPVVVALVFMAVAILLGSFSPILAVIVMIGLVLVVVVLPGILTAIGGRRGGELGKQQALLSTQLTELLYGYVDLKTNNSLQGKVKELTATSSLVVREQHKSAKLTGLSESLQMAISFVTAWLILVVAISLVNEGTIDGVHLALLMLAALTAFEAASPVAALPSQLGENKAAAKRLFELTENPTSNKIGSHSELEETDGDSSMWYKPADFSVAIKQVTFSYPDQVGQALDQVSIHFEPGKKIALVGHSGSGKSSLVNLLAGFYRQQRGSITLGGREVADYPSEQLRSYLGVVAQSNHFFNDTVAANLTLAKPQATEAELVQVLEQVGLSYIDLEQPMGEKGVALSGGERQRLAIARLVLKDAPIWLLDEPTANLDAITEGQIMKLLWSLVQGKSLLYITHRLTGLEQFDQLVVLEKGRLIEQGTFSELVGTSGHFSKMWKLEQQKLS